MSARIVYLLLSVLSLIFTGCSSIPRDLDAPPPKHYEHAQLAGFHHIRFWGDEDLPASYIQDMLTREKQLRQQGIPAPKRADILALSGGGEDGAYGAGFLKGWSERGDRPNFMLVTGISTGALIAPFAFLGSEYDTTIQSFYTETKRQDIFLLTPFRALFGGSALGDTTPLRDIIRREVTPELVQAIAAESRKGRSLLIGTTNLDAQRPMIWDIGQIAESNHPKATQLIGDIMLASASIPGAFPPVKFNVEINGKSHQEIHVDGGVTNQIFTYPPSLDVKQLQRDLGFQPQKTFWLIRNTKIDPVYETVDLGVADLSARAISTLIKYQGRGDLLGLERQAKKDGFAVRLSYVPEDFDVELKEPFDPKYMQALYQVGYKAALSAQPWQTNISDLYYQK